MSQRLTPTRNDCTVPLPSDQTYLAVLLSLSSLAYLPHFSDSLHSFPTYLVHFNPCFSQSGTVQTLFPIDTILYKYKYYIAPVERRLITMAAMRCARYFFCRLTADLCGARFSLRSKPRFSPLASRGALPATSWKLRSSPSAPRSCLD